MSKTAVNTGIVDKIRIDKWLWCARFYKTRQLAASAIKSGKVRVNNSKAKPSRSICAGDRLLIDKKGLVFEVDVSALSTNRLSATLAAELYRETQQSIEAREKKNEIRKLDYLGAIQTPKYKPDKRGRRERAKFKRGDRENQT